MNIAFESSFARDLKRVNHKPLLDQIRRIINEVKAARTLGEIHNLEKMRGYETFYRIRLGEYRIGIEVINEKVIFVRILQRKDIYRYFP